MVLGEFEFETHFYFDIVAESHGQNFSVQIMFVLFVVYGGIIMMNLIMATIVVNQRDASDSEHILIKVSVAFSKIYKNTRLSQFCKGCQQFIFRQWYIYLSNHDIKCIKKAPQKYRELFIA